MFTVSVPTKFCSVEQVTLGIQLSTERKPLVSTFFMFLRLLIGHLHGNETGSLTLTEITKVSG